MDDDSDDGLHIEDLDEETEGHKDKKINAGINESVD